MTLRLIIVLAILFTLSNQLVNETSFTQNFPLISKLYFIEGKLFYISNDEASFGFINKQTGQLYQKWSLQTNQRIVHSSQYQIFICSDNGTFQFQVFSQNYARLGALSTSENQSDFTSIQILKAGIYYVADNQLYIHPYTTQRPPITQNIQIQLGSNQEILQIQNFQNKLFLFSLTSTQCCFRIIDQIIVKNKKCFDKISQNTPKIYVSQKYLFVFYENTNIQLFDSEFNLIQSFHQKILQFNNGSASFSGFKTFNVSSKKIQDWKIVSHQYQGSQDKLKLVSGEYLLMENQIQIAKLPNIISEPAALWINKRQAAIGKAHGKYQLVVQFSTGALHFYQIRAQSGKRSMISLKWPK